MTAAPSKLEALAESEGLRVEQEYVVHPYTPSVWRTAAPAGLELEEPGAVHERWPDLALPGPVRRLWRGTSSDGRTFRLMLIHDPSHTPGRSGFEGLLVEDGGAAPRTPAGAPVEEISGAGLLALVRPTPLPSPTAAGLRELRDAVSG